MSEICPNHQHSTSTAQPTTTVHFARRPAIIMSSQRAAPTRMPTGPVQAIPMTKPSRAMMAPAMKAAPRLGTRAMR